MVGGGGSTHGLRYVGSGTIARHSGSSICASWHARATGLAKRSMTGPTSQIVNVSAPSIVASLRPSALIIAGTAGSALTSNVRTWIGSSGLTSDQSAGMPAEAAMNAYQPAGLSQARYGPF